MSVRPLVTRTVVSRTVVSLAAVAGLGAAFALGTSYGGSGVGGGTGAPGHRHGSDASPAAYTGSDLSLATSCDELLTWYVDRGLDLVGPYGWSTYGGPYPYALEDAAPLPSTAGSAAGEAGRTPLAPAPVRATSDETGTNVQEAGVDEPDVVKTDGRTLFRVQGNDLVTYDVSGAEVQRLASLDLPGAAGAQSTELLLSGDTVVALSQSGHGGGTELVTVDVSDPVAPKVTHTVDYDSSLVTARMVDGVVRVVLSTGLPDLDFTRPGNRTTEYEATQANRDAVQRSTIDDWLPDASVDGGASEPLLDCDRVAIPDDDAGLGTVAVVGFDASAPQAPSVSGLAADTDLVYSSADQLYLATSGGSGIVRGCFECMAPMPVPGPDSRSDGGLGDLLPSWMPGSEDRTPCCVPVPGPVRQPDGTTHLYAFDLDGVDTTFAASGEVDGMVRDRWSMDAVDGPAGPVLRVVVGPSQKTGNFSSVVTFRQDGNDLVEAGHLDDLGVGEEVQSVRWFDTLAIVVTYRQVDPMYAVDLTDADQPRLMGELEIPGYSAYLHPLGQHRLLGLGEGPGANDAFGAQAGLFDVTDLTRPRRLSVVHYGTGTQALATSDPRQLTWLPDGRTVLTVVADYGSRGTVGYVSELKLGGGRLTNRMVEVEYGDEVDAVRLVPLADGRVVLVTGDDASFFRL